MTDRQKRTRSGSETRKRRALVVSVPPELDQVLRDGAVAEGRRLSEHVRELLQLGLDAWERDQNRAGG